MKRFSKYGMEKFVFEIKVDVILIQCLN